MNNKVNYPMRRVFVLDELSIIFGIIVALMIRHYDKIQELHMVLVEFCISFGIKLCIFNIIIFLLYDSRRRTIFEQDPIDNLISVIKSRFALMAILLLYIYIYISEESTRSSGTILLLFFVISIILGYVFRMLYRRTFLKKNRYLYERKVLTVSNPYPTDNELKKMLLPKKYDEVVIVGSAGEAEEVSRLVSLCEGEGVRVYCTINSMGYSVRPGIVTDLAGYAAIPVAVRNEKFKLFGVDYSIARTEEAVLHVMRHIKELAGQYICFSNVHTSVMARENGKYAQVLNESAFTFPDGNPIAVLQRKNGLVGAERVAGPDFMEHMFRDTQDGSISHYFYGAKRETLDALKINLEKKYPGIVIKGLYSPPFRELTAEEDQSVVDMINSAGADIIWIGLGAPKQEKWMQAHKGKINGVMMGVGAGFDFHAGTIKRAPKWIQKVGLEWLYRLFQDPGRLIKRYVITNAKFLWYLFVDAVFKSK